jgi:DNA-binding NarL/FixJ family response regulator
MNILLIEANHIDANWLRRYMERYASDVTVTATKTLADAEAIVRAKNTDIDVIILDSSTPDVLEIGSIHNLIMAAPQIPIVVISTGKSSHYECARLAGTRAFTLRTDVSNEAFLHHLTSLVREVRAEVAAQQGGSDA